MLKKKIHDKTCKNNSLKLLKEYLQSIIIIEMDSITTEAVKLSNADSLKQLLTDVVNLSTTLKNLTNNLRNTLKNVEKQEKELEKLKNKKSRTKSERSSSGVASGITKPVSISDELAVFLGVSPGTLVARNEVTKGVSAFIREHELADPSNKQKFLLDSRTQAQVLKKLLNNPEEEVTYFNLQRYLKHHYLGVGEKPSAALVSDSKQVSLPTSQSLEMKPGSSTGSETSGGKKKTILVKKKKVSTELVEE